MNGLGSVGDPYDLCKKLAGGGFVTAVLLGQTVGSLLCLTGGIEVADNALSDKISKGLVNHYFEVILDPDLKRLPAKYSIGMLRYRLLDDFSYGCYEFIVHVVFRISSGSWYCSLTRILVFPGSTHG